MNRRPLGFFFLQSDDEGFQDFVFAFHLDENTLRGVEHPAGQIELVRKLVNERPEAHPLDGTTNGNRSSLDHGRERARCFNQSHHSGIPAPVVQDVSKISKEGLIWRAFRLIVSSSQAT